MSRRPVLGQRHAYAVNGMANCWLWIPPKARFAGGSIVLPARSAPTVADGRIYLTTIDGKLLAAVRERRSPIVGVSGHPDCHDGTGQPRTGPGRGHRGRRLRVR